MDLLWKDIRYSIHSLRMNPGFALVAILTLALGIGATTAIFTIVNGVLLQPLPLHDPDRLVTVWEKRLNEPDADPNVVAPINYTEWTRQSKRVFSSIGATFDWEMSLTGHGDPELVRGGFVSGSFFPTLNTKPLLGRTISGTDEEAVAQANVVLSHGLWQRKFGGDRRVIGKRVQIDGDTYTISGVMPREFLVPKSRAELWVPYPVPPQGGGRYLMGMARLAPGVTLEQARAEMDVVGKRTEKMRPNNIGFGVTVIPAHEIVVGNVRRALVIVLAAVALLLVIGCVNIANLLLSRATSRSKEMSIRSALGASRAQLIRQLLTESTILAIIAGIVGIVLAGWMTMLMVRYTPESAMMPRIAEIEIDGRVLAATAALTLVTAIFFGLAPALHASRADLQTGLKSGSRGSSHDRGGKMLRKTLVVAEVALATVLLIGAGLLIKSFARLEGVGSGVQADDVLTMRVVLSSENAEGERRRLIVTQVLDKIRTVPGVERAGAIASLNMPFTNSWSSTDFVFEGRPTPPPNQEPSAHIRPLAGDYFRVLGMPVLAGRVFDDRVKQPERTEFVVNEAFVKRYFQGKNAVGSRIILDWFGDLNAEIVGVVGNVRAIGLDKEADAAIYMPYQHDVNAQFTYVVKAAGDPAALQVPLTKAIRSLDPQMPVTNMKTLDDLISGTIARPRFNATMLTLFAALGLLLASLGIYGVLSYSVTQRTQEMGIRMALGADPRDVLKLVVRDGMTVSLLGVAIGVLVALFATRAMAALLFGIEATDPAVFIAVAATLTLVALAASWIPARRATRVDPIVALRPE
ncbi:MAG TPA: ABC transporter permease [Thermoanaerobaculia bacterium]|jgi:putative ABC transport system permease protein